MSGLLKEILLDYGLAKLSVEERADIDLAINDLYRGSVLSKYDVSILHSYVAGYTADEIASMWRKTTNEIELRLSEIVEAVAEQLKISDDQLINYAKRNGYPASKMNNFALFLKEHGLRYMQHTVPNVYGLDYF